MLLLKDDRSTTPKVVDVAKLFDEEWFSRIRCPLCRWRPLPSSQWYCIGTGTPEAEFNGCGTRWNTFTTRGRCPGCSHQWRWTSCHQCTEWSPHDDWYEASSPPPPGPDQ